MKAIILAAGRGTRMAHLTEDQPKCLVELRGRALFDWQIESLRGAGISDIAVVTGYRRELLATRGLTEFHNPRWAETNMVSSLACAESWLTTGPCVVSYSDIFYEPGPVRSLIESSAALAVTYDPNWLQLWEERFGDPLLDAETFRLAPDGVTLVNIGQKPKTVDEVQGQYMGLLRYTPVGWQEVERIRQSLTAEARDRVHMTGMLQKVLDAGQVPVHALPTVEPWGEVDTAEDLAVYRAHGGGVGGNQG